MYTQKNHIKVINISNNKIHDAVSFQKTSSSEAEHSSGQAKRSSDQNRKKIISFKNKSNRNSTHLNTFEASRINPKNKLSLHLNKSEPHTDNNNLKTCKNQNLNLSNCIQKSASNNMKFRSTILKSNGIIEVSNLKAQQNYGSLPATQLNLANANNKNIQKEGTQNNIHCNSNFNQVPNSICFQHHLPNQGFINYNMQHPHAQRSQMEKYNTNSVQFNETNRNEYNSIPSNHNSSPYFVNHVALGNVVTGSNQNYVTNSAVPVTKNNGYITNIENCAPVTQPNRLKLHQNHQNLTYVVTNKENFHTNSITTSNTPQVANEVSSLTTIENGNKNKYSREDSSQYTKSKFVEQKDPSDKETQHKNFGVNGYDSDSSHSSCTKNTFDLETSNEHYFPVVLPHIVNYAITPPPAPENNFYAHAAQQQSLAYFNPKSNFNLFNVYNLQENSNQESATVSTNENAKKLQKKSFSGRKYWVPLKMYQFPENTPPDRFLNKSHLFEFKGNPKGLLNGSKWDLLSLEIWKKFLIYQQKEITYRKKILLWKYLYLSIKANFPRYGLYLVGSTITGFGANCSDVDMCLVHRASFTLDSRFEAISHLNNIKEFLKKLGVFGQFNLIEAKVPILRFCDSNNALEVDLNFNNSVGIRNTHLLYCYSQLDWRLRPLTLITKLWARYHNINNAKTMTISSYSFVLMIIHFLQFGVSPPVLPCLHELYPEKFNIILTSNEFGFVDMIEEIGPYKSENTKSLGELFLLFLEYYSNFNYSEHAISIRTGKVIPIEVCRNAQSIKNDCHQWKELCIEEPFDLTNTARSVYDSHTFDKIKNTFILSWKILQTTLDLNRIFAPLKNGFHHEQPNYQP